MSAWSSIKNGLSQAASSISGKNQKAVLCIQKFSAQNTDGILSDVMKAKNVLSKVADAAGRQDWWKNNDEIMKELGSDFHVMQVQYNPSSISMNAYAGDFAYDFKSGAGENGFQKNVNTKVPAQVNMSIELIFDDMNANDCFRGVTVRSLISSMVNEYSVRKPVEGLLALTTRRATRRVIFHWADMTFVGEIISIQAKYTMFSLKGEPVRASVTITMSDRSADDDAERLSNMSDDYWQNAFNNAFGGAGISSAIKTGSSVSSNKLSFLNF